MRHDDLLNTLARHLRANTDRMVFCDMPMGAAGNQRPDIWTLNKSYANPRPTAYEVKVSKSDYQKDMSTGKWQGYLEYSCAVTFAVPKGLVTKADLPRGCGLIQYDESAGTWGTVKAPTLNPIKPFKQELLLKLLIDGVNRCTRDQGHRDKNKWELNRRLAQRIGAHYARVIVQAADQEQVIREYEDYHRGLEEKSREAIKAAAARDAEAVAPAKRELCQAIGLGEGASGWEIKRRIRDLVEAVSVDAEVKRLNEVIASIERSLSMATKQSLIQTLGEMDDCAGAA